MKWNDYVLMQVLVLHEKMLAKCHRRKNEKNKWWNGKHDFRMVLSALVSAWYLHDFKKYGNKFFYS